MRKEFKGVNFGQGIVKRTIHMSQEDLIYLIKDWEDNLVTNKPKTHDQFICNFFIEYFNDWKS